MKKHGRLLGPCFGKPINEEVVELLAAADLLAVHPIYFYKGQTISSSFLHPKDAGHFECYDS